MHTARERERECKGGKETERCVDAAKVSADVASMDFNESMKV